MPEYKAVVSGENIEFIIDDEPQLLDFMRVLYVEADSELSAGDTALAMVREELLSQSMLEEWDEPVMMVEEIKQVDVLAGREDVDDFIWMFPEEDD